MHNAILFLVLMWCAGCATLDTTRVDAMALYGTQCEKQGHQTHTDAWRACIQSADLNAAIVTQRAYDQKLMRRLDCIDPRFAC